MWLNNCFTTCTNFPVSAGNSTIHINYDHAYQPIIGTSQSWTSYGNATVYPILAGSTNGMSIIIDGTVRGESLPMYQYLTNDFQLTNSSFVTIPSSGYWNRQVSTRPNTMYAITFHFLFGITNLATSGGAWFKVDQNPTTYFGYATKSVVDGSSPATTHGYNGSGNSLASINFGGLNNGEIEGTLFLVSNSSTPSSVSNTQLFGGGCSPTNQVFLKAGSWVEFKAMQ